MPLDEDALASFQEQLDKKLGERPTYENKISQYTKKENSKIALQLFNPNFDSQEELINKGVPARIAQNIVNYRSKGGAYKSKEDLLKLYSITDVQYAKLEPFIAIPITQAERFTKDVQNTPPVKLEIIDLNSASLSELKRIPGIGDVLSERIIRYRRSLGGFNSLSQLEEVYGLRENLQVDASTYFSLDRSKILKIKINTADFKSILRHPYLDYNETKAIINYIEQHGAISSLSEFKNLHIFRDKDVDRILPYLDLN
ncbi:MAG: hypothetical protein HKP14_04620 [Bacteroidia bacterium]|nr:hypothetical protein [Bacteroidia bacterium]